MLALQLMLVVCQAVKEILIMYCYRHGLVAYATEERRVIDVIGNVIQMYHVGPLHPATVHQVDCRRRNTAAQGTGLVALGNFQPIAHQQS